MQKSKVPFSKRLNSARVHLGVTRSLFGDQFLLTVTLFDVYERVPLRVVRVRLEVDERGDIVASPWEDLKGL
jgi:hypothetical protein